MFVSFVALVALVAFVSLVALVSLLVFVPYKHCARQALCYRILYHDFTLVTSEANLEWREAEVWFLTNVVGHRNPH